MRAVVLVVDGASNGGRVAFKACAVNTQVRIVSIINGAADIAGRDFVTVGGCGAVVGEAAAFNGQRAFIIDGAGNIGLVAFKAAAVDGQRAIIPEGTSIMARELGVGDGRFAVFGDGKLVDRAAAGHTACKGRFAVFTDCDHVVSCGITLFKRDGAFNGTLFDGHTTSVGDGALTGDIFDSDRDALIDIHDTAIEREFVEGSVLLVFRF